MASIAHTSARTPSVRLPLWSGLALSALVTAAAFLGTSVIADHISAGYPSYSAAEVGTAATTYVVILTSVGLLGLLGWVGTLLAARAGARWAPWLASLLLLGGLTIAVVGLTTPDTSGEVGLAPLIGWLQLLPCVAGGFAVAALWRRRTPRNPTH